MMSKSHTGTGLFPHLSPLCVEELFSILFNIVVEQAILYTAILPGLYLIRGGWKQYKGTRESGSLIQLFVAR